MKVLFKWNIINPLQSIFYLSILYLVVHIIIGSLLSITSGDAGGYFLNIARDITNGTILYRDLPCVYTPLGIYIWTIPFYIFGEKPDYLYFLIITYPFLFGSAILLYKVLIKYGISRGISKLIPLFYILVMLNYQANETFLEQFVVFWGFLSIYLLLRTTLLSIFLSGISVFLAFYSKQYGIVYIIFGIIYLIASPLQFKKMALYFLGFSIPILLLLIYYEFIISDFSFYQFLENILPIGNQKYYSKITGVGNSFQGFVNTIVPFVLKNGPAYFYAIILFFSFRLKNNKIVFAALFLSLLSFAVLSIAYYLHYFMLIIPAILLFSSLILADINTYIKRKTHFLFLSIIIISPTLLLNCYSSVYQTYTQIANYDKYLASKQLYYENTQYFYDLVPEYSKVFILGDKRIYFTNNYISSNLSKWGYTFSEGLMPSYVLKELDMGSYILAQKDINYKDYMKTINEMLNNNQIEYVGNINNYEIYKKHFE